MSKRILLLSDVGSKSLDNSDHAALTQLLSERAISSPVFFDGQGAFKTAKKANSWASADAYRLWPTYVAHETFGVGQNRFESIVFFGLTQQEKESDGTIYSGYKLGPVNLQVAMSMLRNREPGNVFVFDALARMITEVKANALMTYEGKLQDWNGKVRDVTFGFVVMGSAPVEARQAEEAGDDNRDGDDRDDDGHNDDHGDPLEWE